MLWYMLDFLLATHSYKNYRFTSQHLYFCKNMHKQIQYFSCCCFFLQKQFNAILVCLFVCLFKVYKSSTLVSVRSVRTSSILLESWLCKLLFWYNFSLFACISFVSFLFCFFEMHCSSLFYSKPRSYCSIFIQLTFTYVCPQWRVKFCEEFNKISIV